MWYYEEEKDRGGRLCLVGICTIGGSNRWMGNDEFIDVSIIKKKLYLRTRRICSSDRLKD